MPTVAIIAPSGYAPDAAKVERALSRLQARGWTVRNLVQAEDKYLRFAADDATRLSQLYQAADDPDVDVVLALRGGYGLSRLLESVDFARLAGSGKLFVGFSDFTALQMGMLAQAGGISFAGPMVCEDLGAEEFPLATFEYLERCLLASGVAYEFSVAAPDNPLVQVQGTFWGGNLAMLTHLVGSRFMPQIDGGILFVEDVNENPYRVERMLLQLLHGGILGRQKALLLGHFTNYKASDYDNGYDFTAMLAYIRSRLAIPVLTGLPFGHCANKVTLPLGVEAELSSTDAQLKLKFAACPQVKR